MKTAVAPRSPEAHLRPKPMAFRGQKPVARVAAGTPRGDARRDPGATVASGLTADERYERGLPGDDWSRRVAVHEHARRSQADRRGRRGRVALLGAGALALVALVAGSPLPAAAVAVWLVVRLIGRRTAPAARPAAPRGPRDPSAPASAQASGAPTAWALPPRAAATASGAAGPPRPRTIGEDLERVRLEHRARRIEHMCRVLGERVRLDHDAGHRPTALGRVLEDFAEELRQVQGRLAALMASPVAR